jgi:hypothetical protein
LLDDSQKLALYNKAQNMDEEYKNKLIESLKSEKKVMLQLLRKYKSDKRNISVIDLKGEMIRKRIESIRNLEENEKMEDFNLLEESLNEI